MEEELITQSIHQLDISIKSLSFYVPQGRLSNQSIIDKFIECNGSKLCKSDQEYLRYALNRKFNFLGIKSRSYSEDLSVDNSVSMGVKVAKDAIVKAGMQVLDIDLMIYAGVCNPFREPTFSNVIASQIGLEGKEYYDINDTCNGFIKAIDIASLYISTNRARNVLILTSECPQEFLDKVNNKMNLENVTMADYYMNYFLVGTGAAAVVLTKNEGERVLHSYSECRSAKNWDLSLLLLPEVALPMRKCNQNSIIVQSDGLKIASQIIKLLPTFVLSYMEHENIETTSIDYVFSHQMGRNTTYAVLKKLRLDDKNKFPISTFEDIGNLACANIPISLGMAMEQNILKKGDLILLLSSSCGLNVSALRMIW